MCSHTCSHTQCSHAHTLMLTHICTHSHAHTWSHTHAHTCSPTHTHAQAQFLILMHPCSHTHMFMLTHMHTHSCSYTCTYTHGHTCAHSCSHTHVTHLHTHVHIRTGSHAHSWSHMLTHSCVHTHALTHTFTPMLSNTNAHTHVHTLAHTHSCLHTHHTIACFSRCPCYFLSWRALYREPLTSQPSPWPPCGLCDFLPLKNLPRCQRLGSSLTPLTLFILPCWVLFLSLSISPPQHALWIPSMLLECDPEALCGLLEQGRVGCARARHGPDALRLFVVLGWRRWKKCPRRLLDSVLSFCFPSSSSAGRSFMSPRLVSWQTPRFRGSVLSLAAGVCEGQLQRVSRAYAFHNTPASDTPRSAFLPEPLPLQNSASNKKSTKRLTLPSPAKLPSPQVHSKSPLSVMGQAWAPASKTGTVGPSKY